MTSLPPAHRSDVPSPWVTRFAPLIPASGTVLDLACGHGRHARCLARLGFRVEAVDRDAGAIASLRTLPGVSAVVADLESGPWPFPGRRFEAVVVCNYLWRPLFGPILDALAPAAVLLYETFAVGNEKYGKPSNPDFLLRPGELLTVVQGRCRVIAFEDLYVDDPKPAMVQRICAVAHPRPERNA